MRNLFTKLKALSLALIVAAPLLATAGTAYAQDISNNLCAGANGIALNATGTCASTTTGATGNVNTTITNVVNIFSIIVGIIAVIMIVVGGFRYITSGGKQESVSGAKNTILYAVIGLVIVALAQIIVRFVLNRATNSAA